MSEHRQTTQPACPARGRGDRAVAGAAPGDRHPAARRGSGPCWARPSAGQPAARPARTARRPGRPGRGQAGRADRRRPVHPVHAGRASGSSRPTSGCRSAARWTRCCGPTWPWASPWRWRSWPWASGAVIWVRRLMPDVELTEDRKPLASSEADREAFAETFREGAEASQFVKRPMLRRTLIAATLPLVVAPIVLLRDMGPLPGTTLRHTVWRKGLRLVISGHQPADQAGRLRHARRDDHRDPRGLPGQRRRAGQGDGDHHQVRAGRAQAPHEHELDRGQHRRLLEDLHPRRLPGGAVRADHAPHPVPLPPVHVRRHQRAPRCSSARRTGRCRSCRWA